MNGVPTPVFDALPDDAEELLDAHLATADRVCEGAKYHSPRPLLLYPVRLPDRRKVLLCASCRDSLRVLKLVGPDSDWRIVRCFGTKLRLLLGRR